MSTLRDLVFAYLRTRFRSPVNSERLMKIALGAWLIFLAGAAESLVSLPTARVAFVAMAFVLVPALGSQLYRMWNFGIVEEDR